MVAVMVKVELQNSLGGIMFQTIKMAAILLMSAAVILPTGFASSATESVSFGTGKQFRNSDLPRPANQQSALDQQQLFQASQQNAPQTQPPALPDDRLGSRNSKKSPDPVDPSSDIVAQPMPMPKAGAKPKAAAAAAKAKAIQAAAQIGDAYETIPTQGLVPSQSIRPTPLAQVGLALAAYPNIVGSQTGQPIIRPRPSSIIPGAIANAGSINPTQALPIQPSPFGAAPFLQPVNMPEAALNLPIATFNSPVQVQDIRVPSEAAGVASLYPAVPQIQPHLPVSSPVAGALNPSRFPLNSAPAAQQAAFQPGANVFAAQGFPQGLGQRFSVPESATGDQISGVPRLQVEPPLPDQALQLSASATAKSPDPDSAQIPPGASTNTVPAALPVPVVGAVGPSANFRPSSLVPNQQAASSAQLPGLVGGAMPENSLMTPQPAVPGSSRLSTGPHGTNCWLRISMGPVFASFNNWQRQTNCTGALVTIGHVRAIVTGAHCFYWRNRNGNKEFDWNNTQVTLNSNNQWLDFSGTLEIDCSTTANGTEKPKILRLFSTPENQIVRIHPSFNSYTPGLQSMTAQHGAKNLAIIQVHGNCDKALSKLDVAWVFHSLQIPNSLPLAGTRCEIVSHGSKLAQRPAFVKTISPELCAEKWPLPMSIGSSRFCIEPETAATVLDITDNGGPVYCQRAEGEWALEGIGFLLKSTMKYAQAATFFGSDDFIARSTYQPIPDYDCSQTRPAPTISSKKKDVQAKLPGKPST